MMSTTIEIKPIDAFFAVQFLIEHEIGSSIAIGCCSATLLNINTFRVVLVWNSNIWRHTISINRSLQLALQALAYPHRDSLPLLAQLQFQVNQPL